MRARATLRSLRRASALSAAEWRAVAEAWWELLRADIAVSLRPYAAWRDRVGAGDGRGARTDRSPDLELIRWCGAAARLHPRPMTCLRRALALRAMYERRGHRVEVRFGVRRLGPGLDAHAWLCVDGVEVDTGVGVREDYASLHAAAAGGMR